MNLNEVIAKQKQFDLNKRSINSLTLEINSLEIKIKEYKIKLINYEQWERNSIIFNAELDLGELRYQRGLFIGDNLILGRELDEIVKEICR